MHDTFKLRIALCAAATAIANNEGFDVLEQHASEEFSDLRFGVCQYTAQAEINAFLDNQTSHAGPEEPVWKVYPPEFPQKRPGVAFFPTAVKHIGIPETL